MSSFVGRQSELQQLIELQEKKTASFVVVRGRRRIGKSRLVQEFGKQFDCYYEFTGLPPEKKTTAQHQRDEFSRQMAVNFKLPTALYRDWGDIFWSLSEHVKTRRVLLFFDEISWMGFKDPTFLGKIKNLWDLKLKNNDRLVFVICGSASSWIEKNILSHTGFLGRISLTLTLNELPLSDCEKFWPKNIAVYEKLKVLSVTGGVPKYLEEIKPKQSAEDNIKRLCFTEGGFLVDEFEKIFSDIFLRKSTLYKKIIMALSQGAKEQTELQHVLNLKTIGRLSEYLSELVLAGFVTRDYTWNIQTGVDAKLSRYRLRDNYLRFYLKYIEKNLAKIKRGTFELSSLSLLPEWPVIMGFQFENLVINNRRAIHHILNINPADIICENPYFQNKTDKHAGCQIDYMIQTKFDTLYICEIKFVKKEIGIAVVREIQQKINVLYHAKRFSCRPVLIHVNGVSDEVVDADYFSAIIDASAFFL